MSAELDKYLVANFDRALREEHIQVHYQPVIRTISRRACSFEALARWVDPVRGVIQPCDFIGLLEEHRLIHRLDSYVIRQACAQIRDTIDGGFYPIPISVNLSRLDFELCNIFDLVDECAAAYRIPHSFLYIEITESMFADKAELMHTVIDRFRGAGYQVWMDDFGSGYSSLNVLKDFTFDELKVDMAFLSSFHLRSRKILTSIISMAKDIEIHTLVEGVETEDQFLFLRDIGCEKVQGYLFGEPRRYKEMIEHLRRINVPIEYPRDRSYYDRLGLINVLSAAPFMSIRERNSLASARHLNSIPLALAEVRADRFCPIYYNARFEELAHTTNWGREIFPGDVMGRPCSLSLLPPRGLNMLEEARLSGSAKLYFISGGEYYELQAKCVTQIRDAYCVLLRLDNLSRSSDLSRLDTLDAELRHLCSLFERITVLDMNGDSVTPLFVGDRDETVSGDTVRSTVDAYADAFILPEDRAEFRRFYDLTDLDERLRRANSAYLTGCFRTLGRHGRFSWKQYVLIGSRPGAAISAIRDAEADIRNFKKHFPDGGAGADEAPNSDGNLWKSLVRSDTVRLYWKDTERRYLGVSRGFLEFFGLDSPDAVLGRTDEEIGWRIHTDHVKNDELRVLNEGSSTRDIPARFLVRGENRDVIYSSAPIYDEFGAITGLAGSFRPAERSADGEGAAEAARRDGLTGLLNARGISEETHTYRDEYVRRGVDFVRIHVAIEDFASINQQYGFDHGDRVIAALGAELQKLCGLQATLGRASGFHFVILRQFTRPEENLRFLSEINAVPARLREVNGVPCTLYLSVGMCAYSETGSVAEQAQQAEIRRLADHDENASVDSRILRAGEIFRMYDRLPVAFSVYRMKLDAENNVYDAEYFYVNERYAREQNKSPKDLIGCSVRELFPMLQEEWYTYARRAALDGEELVIDDIYFDFMDKHFYMTASQVIRYGYCAVTYQPLDENGKPTIA